MSPINGLSNSYLQSILGTALQGTGLTTNSTTNSLPSFGVSSTSQADNSQLSPFAQLTSQLQQLQQSDPTKYQQVTQQIATNLQGAATTAQGQGNTTAANQLNQLASDFTSASQNSQLPNIQDLAQAISGGHHHHHHFHAASSSTDSTSSNQDASSTSNSSTSASSPIAQFLSSFQSNAVSNDALNPMNIIMSTLSSAGIGSSNS